MYDLAKPQSRKEIIIYQFFAYCYFCGFAPLPPVTTLWREKLILFLSLSRLAESVFLDLFLKLRDIFIFTALMQ